MKNDIRVSMIYGSTREGRLCDKVAEWVVAQIGRHPTFSLETIDPATLELSWRHESHDNAVISDLKHRLYRSDAFLILTPEYNHSYPAALKFVIDSAYEEWRAKPVGFVSYGGSAGGIRAVEHLRQVFAELQAVTMRNTVSFANIWDHISSRGGLNSPPGQEKNMAVMLEQLHWWAQALREARNRQSYGKVA